MTESFEGNQERVSVEQTGHSPVYDIVQTEHYRKQYAGFWTRFWAYIIDLLIVSAISGIIIKPIFRVIDALISNPPFLLFSPYKIIVLVLFLAYFSIMTKFFSQTIGKMIIGIKVVQKDGGKLTWGTILFREGIGRFLSKLLTLPYLLVIFMPKKEALHDIFADTIVVHEHSYEKEVIEVRQPREGEQLQGGTIV